MKKAEQRRIVEAAAGLDRPVRIAGTGSYLPERVLSNADLEKMVDTTDEWIVTRTGIRERRIASEKEATSDLSTAAAKRALKQAGVAAEDLDGIVVATMTPDMVMPNTGCLVQDRLGARKAACFGLEAACSGFTYGLEIGRQFVRSGAMDHVLVIGAEKLSSFTDWQDRSTCVLFGDGAGAAVLAPDQDGAGHRLITTVIGANGGLADLLKVPGGGSRRPASAETVHERQHFIKMAGREVFKYAVTEMCNAGRDALKRCGLTTEDVDWVVPHQANIRIIQAVAERLKVGLEKWYLNIDRCGNMSAASVAVAFDELVRSGRVQSGDILLMIVFGGGFTWGASVVQW